MASTEKLRSGRYRGIYYDANGDKQRVKGTFARVKDALAAAQEAEVKARRQASVAEGSVSPSITYQEWYEEFSAGRVLESDTMINYRDNHKNHILPQWGAKPLNRIGHSAVQKWVTKISRTLAPSTVHTVYSQFAVTINAAMDDILDASPLVNISLPKIRNKVKTYSTPEHCMALATDLRAGAPALAGHRGSRGRRKPQPLYADAIEFEFLTGLRPSELAGMHDDQVDREGAWLIVRTVYVQRARQMRDWPKDIDQRGVPLVDRALEIYDRVTHGRNMKLPCGITHYRNERCSHALVFQSPTGAPLNIRTQRRLMAESAQRLDLPIRTPYDLRRGYGTQLGHNGVDAFDLAVLMGHSSVRQTQGYVQQNAAIRDRVRAALGEAAVIPINGRGTERGTRLLRQVPVETGSRSRRRYS